LHIEKRLNAARNCRLSAPYGVKGCMEGMVGKEESEGREGREWKEEEQGKGGE
jgi:hypothetical protein